MCESKACSESDCTIPYGYCHCGCGELAPLAKETRPNRGIYRGEPYRFARQHQLRGRTGDRHPCWKGGRVLTKTGYWLVAVAPDHPMADANNNVYEHRLVMSEALGRPLQPEEQVHHKNGDRADNRLENLELLTHREHMRKNSRLTVEDVARIRRRLLDGERQADVLADYEQMSSGAMSLIARGLSWIGVEAA